MIEAVWRALLTGPQVLTLSLQTDILLLTDTNYHGTPAALERCIKMSDWSARYQGFHCEVETEASVGWYQDG